ncbi:MAG TPA: nucleotidyltransferase family protein [Acidobacteriaceae bacterium]|jgi:molybdenum cofactor cytidylyltransferase|nr:nucleotidyltransferase family protein [Acidobacteriaceae bacterium]
MPETAPETGAAQKAAAVVLAAGASRRLGRPKQLVQVEGESLLRRTARLALEAGCALVIVVLGFEAERLRAELAGLPVEVTINANWSSGMGSSLACGVAAARRMRPEMDALLLLVCDQARLTADHLRRLLARHASGSVAVTASGYAGRFGVPAVFAPGLIPELERIEGDHGARKLILRSNPRIVDWPDGADDVDLPRDLPLRNEKRPDPS